MVTAHLASQQPVDDLASQQPVDLASLQPVDDGILSYEYSPLLWHENNRCVLYKYIHFYMNWKNIRESANVPYYVSLLTTVNWKS